ncbi:hypothetical protein [Paenibacillus sp. FSL H7-0331]|uniref:hypothetical protein n=1 Tax=Paenibacillus sp. FSL H7-0331 TaxID=1920421 RepID=UPI00096F8C09|nr:hypothetical protein [Paenibacillus sp. FSL H7-0331]OMF02627.1 hypothetical protein BK127_37095 [Paenibacillus sp. FSL H7-0331]
MKYIYKSIPVFFITLFYGIIELGILDLIVYGEGDRPPEMISFKDLLIYHLGITPIIFFFFVFIFYNVASKLSKKASFLTVGIYFILIEVWIFIASKLINDKQLTLYF